MRPHRLRFTGLGPYPGSVDIDFDALTEKGLYLIVGPTGAGKSTIFEAMTYALFGKTASGREGTIVCDSPVAEKPSVDFDFSHRGRHFRAHREPGVGDKAATPSKQWIREFDSSGNELSTVSQTKLMTSFVSDLIGLNADQFAQIILLPQGKFQEFLMANGDAKKPLLQTIFGTDLYSVVAQSIADQAADLGRQADHVALQLDGEMVAARSAISLLPEPFTGGSEIGTVEDLMRVVAIIEDAERNAKVDSDRLAALHKTAIADRAMADSLAKVYDAARDRGLLMNEAAEQAEAIRTAAKSREANDRARRVEQLRSGRDTAWDRVIKAEASESRLRSDLRKLLDTLAIVDPAVDRLKDSLDSASASAINNEFAKVRAKVAEGESALADNEEATAAAKRLASKIATSSKQLDKLKKDHAALKEARQKMVSEAKRARTAAAELPKIERAVEKLDRALEEADVDSAKKLHDRAVTALKKCEAACALADAALADATRRHTDHLAGALAASLKAGEDCPVCGSAEHPRKARKTADIDVDAAMEKANRANERRVEARTEAKTAEKALAEAKKRKTALPTATEQRKLRESYERTTELAEQLDDLEDNREENETATGELDAKTQDLADAVKDLKRDLKDAETKIKKTAGVISTLGGSVAVRSAIKAVLRIGDLVSSTEAVLTESGKSRSAMEEATNAFTNALSAEGFPNEDHLDGALLDDATADKYKALIDRAEQRRENLTRLEGVIADNPIPDSRPDVDALAALCDELEDKAREASTTLTQLAGSKSQIESHIAKINGLSPDVEKQRRIADKARHAAELINKGAGHRDERLYGLEEWVQRRFFTEICEVATEQMRQLYNNRYTLTLEQGEGKAKKYAKGLDLYVFDVQTGKTRPVQTLSGGEQFLTSLALALALAEVVQRHAGGIELPALFIDEGFGSLDPDCLDDAIEVLLSLQDTGRSIGIITHVEAMRDALPIGISVSKNSVGSVLELGD